MKIVIAATFLIMAAPASAVCIYHGKENVRTTLEQEFVDSPWVVRARVIVYHEKDAPDGYPGVHYRLKIVENFKDNLPTEFDFYTPRDSGGFYMGSPESQSASDGSYLLFLIEFPYLPGNPTIARHAFFVNYACGQSKRWDALSSSERSELARLSARQLR